MFEALPSWQLSTDWHNTTRIWYIDIDLQNVYLGFLYSWPKVRSIFDLAHYKSMGKDVFVNKSWMGDARGKQIASLHSLDPSELIDTHIDLVWPFLTWPDLKCDLDLLRSTWVYFEPSWREKHSGDKIIALAWIGAKLFTKNHQTKIRPLTPEKFDLWSLNGWP